MQYLSGTGNNNLQLPGHLHPVGHTHQRPDVALNAIGTQTTANLSYVFPGNFTINSGGHPGRGGQCPRPHRVGTGNGTLTLTDNGTLTFGAERHSDPRRQRLLRHGADRRRQRRPPRRQQHHLQRHFRQQHRRRLHSTQIVVNSGGQLQASSSTFALGQVNLNIGAVVNAGDLSGNAFDSPLYIPAIDVQYLSGTGNNNLQFQAIYIQPDTLTNGQTLP